MATMLGASIRAVAATGSKARGACQFVLDGNGSLALAAPPPS